MEVRVLFGALRKAPLGGASRVLGSIPAAGGHSLTTPSDNWATSVWPSPVAHHRRCQSHEHRLRARAAALPRALAGSGTTAQPAVRRGAREAEGLRRSLRAPTPCASRGSRRPNRRRRRLRLRHRRRHALAVRVPPVRRLADHAPRLPEPRAPPSPSVGPPSSACAVARCVPRARRSRSSGVARPEGEAPVRDGRDAPGLRDPRPQAAAAVARVGTRGRRPARHAASRAATHRRNRMGCDSLRRKATARSSSCATGTSATSPRAAGGPNGRNADAVRVPRR